jgi:small GTP-binding protein
MGKISFLMKTVFFGEKGVGKRSFLRTSRMGNFTGSKMTHGFEFHLKEFNIRNKIVKIQVWDLAGQPRFGTVRKVYYYGSMGAIGLFDVTRPETLHYLEGWLNEVYKHNGKGEIPAMILGNKIDLRNDTLDHITDTQAENFVSKINQTISDDLFKAKYIPISAKEGINIRKPFEILGSRYIDYINRQKW